MRKAAPPKRNLTVAEFRALQTTRQDSSIVILPADKGNAAVVMNSVDYDNKIKKLLSDPVFKTLARDPTQRIAKTTTKLIKAEGLPTDMEKKVIPRGSVSPRLYGLPKIYKLDTPLSPVVSAIGAQTYSLAHYLTGLFQPLIGNCTHHVKNSTEFVENLKFINLQTSDLLVSFTVVSLFTRVPLQETLRLLERHFKPSVWNYFSTL